MMENQPYLLAELEDLSPIFSPLKTTSRIKYTCFNASNNFLIFGATSGGLYVFRREPCCFLQLLPNKEGAVTQVSISHNEKLIAFSTVRGTICVLEKTSHGAKHLMTTMEHQNESVTSLQWNTNSEELFVGDGSGKVSIVMVSLFPTKGMFQTPSFVLMQLDSRIVQMDYSSSLLLVSTLTKCYICDTKKEIFRQIGHKLRDGEYGACIFDTQARDDGVLEEEKPPDSSDLTHLRLLCARPGSRIWECSIDGTVLSTHHFKKALAVPPRKISFLKDSSSQISGSLSSTPLTNGSASDSEQINSNYSEQSFNFQKLNLVSSRFFFTFKTDGIYVFDPRKGVVLWNNQITNIVDAKSAADVIYVWSAFTKLYALNLVSLEKYLIRLYFQKKYLDLARLCSEYKTFLMSEPNNHNKLYVLQDLDEKLNADLPEDLKPLIKIYKEMAEKKKIQNAHKFKSDIYVVGRNVHFLLEDKRLFGQNKLLRPTCLNLKGRSHSVSPERFQNGASSAKTRGSTASLPDLLNDENGSVENADVSPSSFIVSDSKIEKIMAVLDGLRHSEETPFSKNLTFTLLDNILELERFENHETIRPLALNKYFGQPELALIGDCFRAALTTNAAAEWIASWKLPSGENLSKTISSRYPAVLASNLPPETLELDYRLSKLLRLFGDVLPEPEIVDLTRKSSPQCYYRSLMEILDFFGESSVSDPTFNLDKSSSSPKFLNALYFLIKVGQVDKCAERADKIDSTDFFYLMLRHEENSTVDGRSGDMARLQCHTTFLTWMDKALRKVNPIERTAEIVDEYLIICLENINSTASSTNLSTNCDCGFGGSILPQTMAIFPEIGYELVGKIWPKSRDKCIEICSRINFLWRYLVHLQRNESVESVLPLILHSGYIEELENRSSEVDEGVLETATKSLIALKSGTCLNCGRKMNGERDTISWTDFGMLCIKLIGSEKTVDLFSRHANEISSKELNQSFFQGLIFSAIMDKRKNGLRKNLVDALSGKKKNDSSRTPVMSDAMRRRVFHGDQTILSSFPENNSHHWGVKVNLRSNCAVCGLPLDTKSLVVESGLVVFRCGHAFHSACLQKVNLKCPLCRTQGDSKQTD